MKTCSVWPADCTKKLLGNQNKFYTKECHENELCNHLASNSNWWNLQNVDARLTYNRRPPQTKSPRKNVFPISVFGLDLSDWLHILDGDTAGFLTGADS